ncbi:MAG: hypothetical protein Q9182_001559 [Xanthomendoza sp. 2 TL-2023]
MYQNPDPFMSPTGPAYHHGITPSQNQAMVSPVYRGSPPLHQRQPSVGHTSTPASDPRLRTQGSDLVESSMISSAHGKSMKHETCWFWRNSADGCKLPEEQCLYAHAWQEGMRVAGKPIHREPGMAGKNAEKTRPDYIDWRSYHAGGSFPSLKHPLPPRVQAQIESIRSKHEPAYSDDPKIKELQQALQRSETSSLEKRQADTIETAEHEARLDARIRVYDELIERLGESQSSLGREAAASEELAHLGRSSSDPTHSPGGHKSTKVAVEASNPPAVNTSKVLTDLVSENQALRHAVHDLAQVVSTVMTSNVAIKSSRNRLNDELFDLILKLPPADQDAFLLPFARSTQVAEASRPAEEDAKRAMDAVRNKMVEIGQGGLLTAWDRDFCTSEPGAS